MEACSGADEVATPLEHDAAPGLRFFQLVKVDEVPVDEHGIGERPEMFGGLQLGGIRRQEEQMHMVGHAQLETRVPAGPIEDEDDLLGGSRARLLREGRELGFEDRDAHLRGLVKEGPARGRMDKADEPVPREAVLDHRMRPRTSRRPDAPQQRLEADAMLVGRPELNGRVGERGGHLAQQRP